MQITGATIVQGRITNVGVTALLQDTGGRADKELTFAYRLMMEETDFDYVRLIVMEALLKSVTNMGGGYNIIPRNVTVKIGQPVSDQAWR